MRLTLRQLLIFTAIADAGSTTAAGLRLALSQSATSGALNELENLLGAQLFDRVGKRLLLNDNGRSLLPQARALLESAQDIESQLGGGSGAAGHDAMATRLRIGASTTIGNYLLPALVASYLRAWPAAGVDVQIGNTRDVAGAVTRLEVDMGLIEGPCREADVRVVPWREDDLVIVCAPMHPLVQSGGSECRSRHCGRRDGCCANPALARAKQRSKRCCPICITLTARCSRAARRRSSRPPQRAWVSPASRFAQCKTS